jgi:hypothetical protein
MVSLIATQGRRFAADFGTVKPPGYCQGCCHSEPVRMDADGTMMLFCNNLDNKTIATAVGFVRGCGSCRRYQREEAA